MTRADPRRAGLIIAALVTVVSPAAATVVGDGSPASCTDAAWGAALAAGGTVTFACGPDPVVIPVGPQTIGGTVVVDGERRVTLDAGSAAQHFHVLLTGDLTLEHLVLANGKAHDGGAIQNDGILALDHVTFSGCVAEGGSGGAVYNTKSLTGDRVVFTGNTATFNGGGLFNKLGNATLTRARFQNNGAISGGAVAQNGGSLELTGSLLAGNEAAAQGGAIAALSGAMTLTNVTIASNTAAIGGAIYLTDTATITNCTFADQRADTGGILFTGAGALARFRSSIVARSSTQDGSAMSLLCAGDPILSLGFNVAVNQATDDSCAFAALGDQPNTDPELAMLAAHGGFTHTMALVATSPAVDAGATGGCPETDQRDAARPFDGDGGGTPECDAGAFEFGVTPPELCAGDDDDGDGLTDCADPDCNTAPACTSGECAVEATFESLTCRLTTLAALIASSPELGRFQAKVQKRVDGAGFKVDDALGACRSGRTKPAARKLRAAARLLGAVEAKIGSKRGRATIPAELIERIVATTSPLRGGLETFASAPVCP